MVGITDEAGIFRTETLEKIARATDEILKIEGVIVEDVISFKTTDNITSDEGMLRVRRIMEEAPTTEEGAILIKSNVNDNPLP